MQETFPCTFDGCERVFTKGYELKKHIVTHENPEKVWHCTECDFITLSKRRLAIHFAIHTGEKTKLCPDMVQVGDLQVRCDFKTHDPAALSKHRKRVHGYVPPPNRSRPKATTPAPRKTNADKPTQRRTRSERPAPASPRKRTRSPRKTKAPPLDVDAMDVDADLDPDYDPTYIDSDDEMDLGSLFDPSLRSQWMAKFEESYTTFDLTGSKRLEPVPEILDPIVLEVRTGREGCLCPEWMVEAGIEGWDDSVLLDMNKERYILCA